MIAWRLFCNVIIGRQRGPLPVSEKLMFDELSDRNNQPPEDERFELMQELERNTSEAIRKARSSQRLEFRCSIVVQAGNSSERRNLKVKGVTGNISSGGCQVLLPVPLGVGDVYRISFDPQVLKIPLTFARCLRSRLIREDAFEFGFAFFKDIDLESEFSKTHN